MRTIKVYALHNGIKTVAEFLKTFNITHLAADFEFVWEPVSPDLLVVTDQYYSKYKKNRRRFKQVYGKSRISLFVATEAIFPDFNVFDYAIGWDGNIEFDRYCQLPPTFIYPARHFIEEVDNNISTIEEARVELAEKKGFCSFLYSNWKAHKMRDSLFYALSDYKTVDSLGKHLNNVSKKGTGYIGHRKEGISLKHSYKFSISSENACFRGYTTEKIYTSFNAHSIPIYWGDPDVADRFNPKAFINVSDFESLEDMVEMVKAIDNDDDKWCEMVMQPWRTDEQKKKDEERFRIYIQFWRRILDNLDTRHVPEGTMPDIYKFWFFRRHLTSLRKLGELVGHKLCVICPPPAKKKV